MLAFYLHGSGGICRSTVRGGSRLSYINNHYGRTSSLPIVVFTSAHGCFYYSEQNAWDIGWEKHLFGAPRIVMSLLIGFLVMLEKWGRSICLFLSFGLLPINRESCFQLWPGEQHPAWQSLPGDLAPVTQGLGEQPPKNELPVSFRSLAALLRATGKHLHLITFSLLKIQPSPKATWSPFLRQSCHGGRRSGPPSFARLNGVTELNQTNIG